MGGTATPNVGLWCELHVESLESKAVEEETRRRLQVFSQHLNFLPSDFPGALHLEQRIVTTFADQALFTQLASKSVEEMARGALTCVLTFSEISKLTFISIREVISSDKRIVISQLFRIVFKSFKS